MGKTKYPKGAFAIAKRDLKAGQSIEIILSGKQKSKDLKFLPHGKRKLVKWMIWGLSD